MHCEKKVNWNWDKFEFNNSNTNWFLKRVRESFAQYVKPNSKILEIGCGTGNILTYISKEKNCDCYGIDISSDSEEVIKYFEKNRGTKIHFMIGDGFNVPYPDNYFDVVYSEGVIEHFNNQEIIKMVDEHVRVCRPDGIIIISVPNQFNIFLTIAKKVMGHSYPHNPEKSYTIFELKNLVESRGTKVVGIDGFAWQQGLAFWRVIKKSIYLLKFFPDKSLPPKLRAIIGHECMVIAKKI
jgi:ubiquinone/menaquinone biosynthesis C-methylase UbiE